MINSGVRLIDANAFFSTLTRDAGPKCPVDDELLHESQVLYLLLYIIYYYYCEEYDWINF